MTKFEILVLCLLSIFLIEHMAMSIYIFIRNAKIEDRHQEEREQYKKDQKEGKASNEMFKSLINNLIASNDVNCKAANELWALLKDFETPKRTDGQH